MLVGRCTRRRSRQGKRNRKNKKKKERKGTRKQQRIASMNDMKTGEFLSVGKEMTMREVVGETIEVMDTEAAEMTMIVGVATVIVVETAEESEEVTAVVTGVMTGEATVVQGTAVNALTFAVLAVQRAVEAVALTVVAGVVMIVMIASVAEEITPNVMIAVALMDIENLVVATGMTIGLMIGEETTSVMGAIENPEILAAVEAGSMTMNLLCCIDVFCRVEPSR